MQRRSLEVLHHEVIGADVVQDADVRMAQRRNGSRFLQRALAVPGSERLDRHRSTQTGVIALYTVPIPPSPIFARISYGPGRVPGVRATCVASIMATT
jgi:hypothetical protein